MTKILVLYHSSWGHVEKMAHTVAEGARAVAGSEVVVKRVPETMTEEQMKAAHMKVDQEAPVATIDELPEYDAIIFGTPTRFGMMTGQMRTFLDQTGKHWASGALIGKVGSVFTSTGVGGGNETTITSFHVSLLHQGFVIVGLPYSCPQISDISQPRGGSPYGAGALSNSDGSREVSENELEQCRFQGRHVAEITKKMHG